MYRQFRQGDVLVVEVARVPRNVKSVRRSGGRVVLAHGEATGHAHVIVDESAELVTDEAAAELYLLVHGPGPVALRHEEHDSIAIPPGRYQVVRQREYSPESGPWSARWVAD